MNLFIDTNILLNFFHFAGEDLEQLRKLIAGQEHSNLVVWTTEQQISEFYRNRDGKIEDGIKQPRTFKFSYNFPAYFRTYKEHKEFQALAQSLSKKHSELMDKVLADVSGVCLEADKIVADLFAKARKISTDDEVYAKALRRLRVGNPPGKKSTTAGDEINWEALKSGIPVLEDLHVVSVDGDYKSPLDENKINSFLYREWMEDKKSEVFLYTSLASFFNAHYPNVVLARDIAKQAAISNLAASGSFFSTHVAISNLSRFVGTFSAQDIDNLVQIAESNSQVGYIINDSDVEAFYRSLLESGDAPEGLAKRLNALLDPWGSLEGGQSDDDDIPF